jgi:hypothetical protein
MTNFNILLCSSLKNLCFKLRQFHSWNNIIWYQLLWDQFSIQKGIMDFMLQIWQRCYWLSLNYNLVILIAFLAKYIFKSTHDQSLACSTRLWSWKTFYIKDLSLVINLSWFLKVIKVQKHESFQLLCRWRDCSLS